MWYGFEVKRRSVSKVISPHDVTVCFFLETRLNTCMDNNIYQQWDGKDVKWRDLDSDGRSIANSMG